MDEAAAAAAIKEDGADKKPNNEDETWENNVVSKAGRNPHGVGVFCCRCGEAFREESAYLEHRQHHLQEDMHLGGRLERLNNGETDKKTANFCTSCSVSFVEASDFHLHMEKNHSQISPNKPHIKTNSGITKQKTYECLECGKCYGVIGHFLNHQRSHRLASKSLFHDLDDLKKKQFQCETCGRNYSRASALDAHRRCHEEKLIKATNKGLRDVCHTEESVVEAKPSEIQVNDSTEKAFKCSCGKAFITLMRLKTHQRFSRNSQCPPEEIIEKPKKTIDKFRCDECKKTFSGHIALYNHQRWHANHSDNQTTKFPCEQCGKVFVSPTFYYKHQRTVHSDETPAKSFDHQVCQLQKKAFECKDCGLKFSRASALHSHQLHHTDVFSETEKDPQLYIPSLPQPKISGTETKGIENKQLEWDNVPPIISEENSHTNDIEEDVDSYEPGDFNVQVISASESEDESVRDVNPDLELLCESDQEVREYETNAVSKSELDLKIVQIDDDLTDVQPAPIAKEEENNTTEERFDCPECYRWFSSASSLRVHRVWHGIQNRRRQNQAQRISFTCEDCGMMFTDQEVFSTHLHQHALEEDEQMGDSSNSTADLDSEKRDTGENNVDTGVDADESVMSTFSQMKTLIQDDDVSMDTKNNQGYGCSLCGKVYSYMTAFKKHKQWHKKELSRSHTQTDNNSHNFKCPWCGLLFTRQIQLLVHLRDHQSQISFESQPVLRCDTCAKDYANLRSWMTHMQLHEDRPFWCLSCARGFINEGELDKHLQRHDSRIHKCNICHKSFSIYSHLTDHCNTHTGLNPYQCALCGNSFRFAEDLILHKKNHIGGCIASSGMPLGIKNAIIATKQVLKKIDTCSKFKEKTEMDTNLEGLSEKEERAEKNNPQKPCETAGFKDQSNSDESDCGEPAHQFKSSGLFGLVGTDTPTRKSGTVEPQVEEEMGKSESQEACVLREHKYWHWECWECDMGFDEVEKLHLHYIKHATGELPIIQDDVTDS